MSAKNPRRIDQVGQSVYQSLGRKYSLVPNKQIATWKSLSIITFFAGLVAASVWFSAYHLEQDSIVIDTKMFSSAKEDKEKAEKGGVVGRADDRILVKFKEGVSIEKRRQSLEKHNLKEKSEIKGIGVKIINLPSGKMPEEVVAKLLNDEKNVIEFAEVDSLLAPDYIPNDPLYPNEWHVSKMKVTEVWDNTKGSGITVAVLDSGTDCNHPDLSLNCVTGWNFYDNNNNTSDVTGHGTKVAGTIAAIGDNVAGVAGVSYQSKIMPVRISDPTGYAYWSTIASGITWAADRGARVVSNSFASSGSASVQSAATYLRSKNGIFVASAGNAGTLLGGDVSSVVTVGATDSSDKKASWSNYGPQIDVTAPGVGIYTTTSGGGYGSVSGTSFSAPNTAAVLALLFSVKPGLSPSQAESILESTVVDLGALGKDDLYGYGRVNAAAAVAAALGASTPTPDTTAPTTPTNLTATPADTSITLNWTASTDNVGVTQYLIYRDGVQIGTSTRTDYTDTVITPQTMYTYAVKAADAAGNNSPLSNTISATALTTPFAITSIVAKVTSATTATVTWTTNAVTASSGLEYGTSPTNLGLSATVSGNQTTTHTANLSGLSKKTRYYYRVTVTSPTGAIATSSVLNFTTRPK